MWVPLVVLAVLSIGGGWIGIQTMLRNTIRESEAAAGTNVVFSTAWQGKLPGEFGAAGGHEPTEDAPHEQAGQIASGPLTLHAAHEYSHANLVIWVMPAFVLGIGAAWGIYVGGYRIANSVVRIWPMGWIHKWLYHRMYFDELYYWFFVQVVMTASEISAAFDRYVVDGVVNGVAWLTRQASIGAGMNDQYVVDGAVNGVADLAQEIGAAVRTPQSGRIRLYVTVLMIAVALGLAGAIIVVLS
jgi:NADH-quinone oxidoreductase subunit L